MASSQHRPPKPPGTDRESATPPVVRPMPWIDFRELHPRLGALLHRVQEAERTAVGNQRRPTFRLMRELLGASVRLGVPTQQLAECLGRSRESVRNRASGRDGRITPELIHLLTGLTPAQLDQLSHGELTRVREHIDPADPVDEAPYLTTDLVRALLNTPRPRRAPVGGDANEDQSWTMT